MADGNSLVTLNCYCIDDPPQNILPIDIPYDAKITDLIVLFTEAYKKCGFGVVDNLILYQVDCPETDLTATFSQHLMLNRRVECFWPRENELDEGRVQVFIRAIKHPTTIPYLEDSLSNLPDLFQRLELRQAATASSYRTGIPASQAATVSSFIVQQGGDNPLLNGRPLMRTGLPIQLYHPIFDIFTKALDTTQELGNSKYAKTEELLHVCQDLFGDEKRRWKSVEPHLCQILHSLIDGSRVEKCEAGGAITFVEPHGLLKAYCAILEVNNEVGIGESDPSVRGGESYGIYWSQEQMSKLRRVCHCPSFIIALAGPWMCILGAVYLEHVVVQPLTDYLWLGHHPQQDQRLSDLTRVFYALENAIRELEKYYASLFADLGPPSQANSLDTMRFFPYFRSFKDEDLQEIEFDYLAVLGEGDFRRPVFKAVTKTGEDIAVKFAERYDVSAHRMLASHGLAPRVLFYEPPRSRTGLHTIVMEYVPSTHLHHDGGGAHLENVKADIQKAMNILHENDLVFGDIRTPNILVMERSPGVYGGMLIDFDWCGQEGKVRYPASMVLEDRASAAEKGGLISKEHDRETFRMVF